MEKLNSIKKTEQPEAPKQQEIEPLPNLVNTEDLILELGKKEVDRINKEKVINQLVKKVQTYETQFKFIQTATEKKIKSLEDNNTQLKEMLKNQISDMDENIVEEINVENPTES